MLLEGTVTGRARRRFDREIEIAANLRHPHIVSVFDSGMTADGRRYVAMEFVPGRPLDWYAFDKLKRRGKGRQERQRIDQCVRLTSKIAAGVAHAHANGVVHRDLKPSNVLVDSQGVPRVVDFGLARPASIHQGAASLTHEFVGTPAFAAPEQFSGDPTRVDARTDVYALGVIFYGLLTGRQPYPCEGSLAELVRHITHTDPTPPSRYLPRFPRDLETIVLKSLAKAPDRRYPSAGALVDDLEDYLASRPISARRDSTLYVLHRLAMRHRIPAAAVLLVVITILCSTIGLVVMARDLDRQRRAALENFDDSTFHRARLMAATGEMKEGERLLWTSAIQSGFRPQAPLHTSEPSWRARRGVWGLMEYYSHIPRLMRAHVPPATLVANIDPDARSIHTVSVDGSSRTHSLEGVVINSSPAWITYDSARGDRVYLSPDGTRAAVYSQAQPQGELWIADPVAQTRLAGPILLPAAPKSARFSDDSRWLGVALPAGTLRILDASTLSLVHELVAPDGEIESIAFSRDRGQVLACVKPDRQVPTIRVWSTDRWIREPRDREVGEMEPLRHHTFQFMSITDDGATIAAAMGPTVLVWHTDTPPDAPLWADHGAPVRHLVVVPPGAKALLNPGPALLTTSADGVLRAWRLADLSPIQSWRTPDPPVAIDIDPDHDLMAIVDATNSLSAYPISERPFFRTFDSLTEHGVYALAASADGSLVAWGSGAGDLRFRNLRTGLTSQPIDAAGDAAILCCDLTPDGDLALIGDDDGRLRIWDTHTSAVVQTLVESGPQLWSACFSPDGRWIAAADFGGRVRVWDRRTSAEPRVLIGPAARTTQIRFSHDGALLAMSSIKVGAPVTVWDAATGLVVHQLPMPMFSTRAVAFSHDSSRLAAGSDQQSVHVFNLQTAQRESIIPGLPWHVFDLAYHPSGHVLFCIGRGPELLVLDPDSQGILANFKLHTKSLFAIALRADGTQLITSGEDRWLGLWDFEQLRTFIKGNENYWIERLATTPPQSTGR